MKLYVSEWGIDEPSVQRQAPWEVNHVCASELRQHPGTMSEYRSLIHHQKWLWHIWKWNGETQQCPRDKRGITHSATRYFPLVCFVVFLPSISHTVHSLLSFFLLCLLHCLFSLFCSSIPSLTCYESFSLVLMFLSFLAPSLSVFSILSWLPLLVRVRLFLAFWVRLSAFCLPSLRSSILLRTSRTTMVCDILRC